MTTIRTTCTGYDLKRLASNTRFMCSSILAGLQSVLHHDTGFAYHPLDHYIKVDNSQLTTISNLLTNRTYTVSVLAFTAVGDGPLSEPIKVRTQQGGMYHTLCPSPLCIYHATAFSKESRCYNVLLLMILVF